MNRETLKTLQDVVWSDDEVSGLWPRYRLRHSDCFRLVWAAHILEGISQLPCHDLPSEDPPTDYSRMTRSACSAPSHSTCRTSTSSHASVASR